MKNLLYIAILTSCAAICSQSVAEVVGEWTFDSGATTAERLAISAVQTGVTIFPLAVNPAVDDFGPEAVPNNDEDGMGFGGTVNGNQVLFWHRANFFNSDGIGTTTWAAPGSDGIDTTSATAPMSFTVTAKSGYDITIESITVESENSGYLIFFQEAGRPAGAESGGVTEVTTALLNSPVIISSGTSKTFTLNWNSGALNKFFIVDAILVNGAVELNGNGPTQWAGFDILNEAGDVDTGNLLGIINVSNGDWVWSYDSAKWIYLPESLVTQAGTWNYVPANQ